MIKIDTYYDVGCDNCGKNRSTDFEMGMELNKKRIRLFAKEEGWTTKDKQTLCPNCSKHQNLILK